MNCLDIANQYLDAWNAHDADAIVNAFAAEGTFCDPSTGVISGDEIGANAEHLWKAFPDLSFEIVSLVEAGSGKVVAAVSRSPKRLPTSSASVARSRRVH